MTPHEFLDTLYPNKPDDLHLLLWQDKKSHWFTDIAKAAEFATNNPNDCYHGIGLSPKNFGKFKRCKAKQIAAIPGLWFEIDVGKENSPQTILEAMTIIDGLPFKATVVIGSGTGLHVYFLFKEILRFDTPEEREQAAHTMRRLLALVKDLAANNGWTVDSVSDLSRIFRPAGTLNCKHDPHVKVKIIMNNGPRYGDLNDFDEFLPEIEKYEQIPTADNDELFKEYREMLPYTDYIEIIMDTKQKKKFSKLFKGEWKGDYISQSDAEMALCCIAAFYSKDPVIIDQIYRKSKFNRSKWDRKSGKTTIGKLTIKNALAFVTASYTLRSMITYTPEEQEIFTAYKRNEVGDSELYSAK